VVLVTAPDLKTARALAREILKARAAACANLVPRVESHYWWKGKIEKSGEVMMVLKTTRRKLGRLAAVVREHHPYDTPEILALGVAAGDRRYLAWVDASVGQLL
jgi:periplasmic divalent cation tolerance protein